MFSGVLFTGFSLFLVLVGFCLLDDVISVSVTLQYNIQSYFLSNVLNWYLPGVAEIHKLNNQVQVLA